MGDGARLVKPRPPPTPRPPACSTRVNQQKYSVGGGQAALQLHYHLPPTGDIHARHTLSLAHWCRYLMRVCLTSPSHAPHRTEVQDSDCSFTHSFFVLEGSFMCAGLSPLALQREVRPGSWVVTGSVYVSSGSRRCLCSLCILLVLLR